MLVYGRPLERITLLFYSHAILQGQNSGKDGHVFHLGEGSECHTKVLRFPAGGFTSSSFRGIPETRKQGFMSNTSFIFFLNCKFPVSEMSKKSPLLTNKGIVSESPESFENLISDIMKGPHSCRGKCLHGSGLLRAYREHHKICTVVIFLFSNMSAKKPPSGKNTLFLYTRRSLFKFCFNLGESEERIHLSWNLI